jgi:hypothetical protein
VVIIQQVVFAEELRNGIERISINLIITVFKAIFLIQRPFVKGTVHILNIQYR